MLYVVCGYPASGKSTYCRDALTDGSIVFDMDALHIAMTCSTEHERRMVRNIGQMLNDFAHWLEQSFPRYGITDMHLIRMAPTDKEMAAYAAREDVQVLIIDTPKDICLTRAQHRGDFDLATFGRACGKVERFMRLHDGRFTRVSIPPPPLAAKIA